MNRADRCSVRTCWSFGVTQTNQFLGEVWVNERGQRISRPLTPRRSWLRGLDLNQRPLGYEYNTAMPGNPLILREKRSTARSSTFSVDASFLLLFRPVSGCCGCKMGAAAERSAACPLVSRYLLGRNAEVLREYGDRPRVRFLHFAALDTGDLLWGKAV